MTSNGWAEIVLVGAVAAPLAAVFFATAVALPNQLQQWTTVSYALSALGALVLLVAGQHPDIGGLAPDDLALAAMIGTMALALATRTTARGELLALTSTAGMIGLAVGEPGRPSTVAPLLAVAVVSALSTVARDAGIIAPAVVGLSTVGTAWGLRTGGRGGAAAVVLGVVAVAIAAAFVSRRSLALVLPTALVLGLRVAPTLSGTSTARWVSVAAGASAVAVALAPAVATRWRLAIPAAGAVLVPWVLAAAVEPVPGTSTAARALAIGAVLAVVLGGPITLLAALPGTTMLAGYVIDGSGWPRTALGLLLLLTLAAVVFTRTAPAEAHIRTIDVVALAVGGWFLVRPTAWTWAHVARLSAYNDGSVAALAAALIVFVVSTERSGRVDVESLAPWVVTDAADADTQALRWRRFVPVVTVTVAMGLAAALLVRSARL